MLGDDKNGPKPPASETAAASLGTPTLVEVRFAFMQGVPDSRRIPLHTALNDGSVRAPSSAKRKQQKVGSISSHRHTHGFREVW